MTVKIKSQTYLSNDGSAREGIQLYSLSFIPKMGENLYGVHGWKYEGRRPLCEPVGSKSLSLMYLYSHAAIHLYTHKADRGETQA